MTYFGFAKFAFVAWAITLGTVAEAACEFETYAYRDELANPAQIERISVEINKGRKWFKNSISILASSNKSIEKIHKENFKAKVKIQYRFGSCAYPARVRQNGDWKDHIKLLPGGNVISSLDVKLQEGNVLNAVRFKLLLPFTRRGINEVLGTLLMQELGYLSPETFLVPTDINNVQHVMLFQENAEKELLERRLRREGPIFEGDESLLWNWPGFEKFELEDVSLARQTNSKWAEKGEASTQISLNAFKRLQSAYAEYTNKYRDYASKAEIDRAQDKFFGLVLTPNTDADEPTFENYALVLLAMRGGHALRPHNRKFYFNSFTQAFEPIYYDGNINILVDHSAESTLSFRQHLDHFLDFASAEVIGDSAARIKTLKDDPNFLRAFLDRAGADVESAKTLFDAALPKISERLLAYHAAMMNRSSARVQKGPKDSAALQRKLNARVREHNLDMQYINVVEKTETGSYLANFAFDDRAEQNFALSSADLIGVMSKNTYAGKRVSLLPDPMAPDTQTPQTLSFLGGEIVLSKGAQADVNYADQTITVTQKAANDWVLIRGVTLENWDVTFEGAQQDPTLEEGQRFNEFGLTGCLNFYDVTFENVAISGQNGQCEDTVNIVSSRGTLRSLAVKDGFADAIDIDFAQIMIDRLEVLRTGNDCFDVSTGVFEINHSVLAYCGDKGISVGENSLLDAASVDIRNALIGVSSKDFSRVNIVHLSSDLVDICAEAFQKKQEFGGGYLRVEDFQCDGEVNQGPASKIALNQVTQ